MNLRILLLAFTAFAKTSEKSQNSNQSDKLDKPEVKPISETGNKTSDSFDPEINLLDEKETGSGSEIETGNESGIESCQTDLLLDQLIEKLIEKVEQIGCPSVPSSEVPRPKTLSQISTIKAWSLD